MKNHLESKHPGSLDSKLQAQTSGIWMAGCMLPDIRNFVSTSPKMTTQRYSVINKKLVEVCAMDYCPISIVNGQGFKRFVQALDPNYTVPSHTTIRIMSTDHMLMQETKLNQSFRKHQAYHSLLICGQVMQLSHT